MKANLFTRLLAALCALLVGLQLDVAPAGLRLGQASAGIVSAPFNPANSVATYRNLSATSLPKWRLAVAKMQAGTYRPKVLIVGDSLSIGAGAGTGGSTNYNAAYAASYPVALAAALNGVGIPAQIDSAFGRRTNGVTAAAYDPRLIPGTGWSTLASFPSLGGEEFTTSTATAPFGFLPASQYDSSIVYYVQQAGSPSFTINVDGGAALATVNAAGTTALGSATVTTTLGTHTLNIQATSALPLYIIGIDTFNSASKKVSILTAGFGGAKAAGSLSWSDATQPWYALGGIGVVAPDLCIIALGANDKSASTAAATYKTSIQTIITKCQLSGDVILVQEPPADPASGYGSPTLSPQYNAALQQLADANSCVFVDLEQRYGSYTSTSALGYAYDAVHLTNYQDSAAAVAKAVLFPLR